MKYNTNIVSESLKTCPLCPMTVKGGVERYIQAAFGLLKVFFEIGNFRENKYWYCENGDRENKKPYKGKAHLFFCVRIDHNISFCPLPRRAASGKETPHDDKGHYKGKDEHDDDKGHKHVDCVREELISITLHDYFIKRVVMWLWLKSGVQRLAVLNEPVLRLLRGGFEVIRRTVHQTQVGDWLSEADQENAND